MADLSPLSFKPSTTIPSQRIVVRASAVANGVKLPAGASNAEYYVGVTTDTVLDTTQSIPVRTHGRAFVIAGDTIAAGALIGANASGAAVSFTAVTATTAYVGYNLGLTAVAGDIMEIMVEPGQASGG
jgi:hypothetical protein